MRRTLQLMILAASIVAAPPVTHAATPLFETEDARLDVSGYVRSLAGVQRVTYDTLGLIPEDTGMSTSVLRLAWHLDAWDWLTLEVHDRFLLSISSNSTSLANTSLGIGATAPPERTLDLTSNIVEENGLLFSHDLDRFAVRIFTEPADIVVGRQAITWGSATLFGVSDVWAQFSPFDLDTSQKPGIDAIRVITLPWDSVELDFVLADRGSLEDLSGGVRANLWLGAYDVYVAAAKTFDEVILASGLTTEVGSFTLRLEGILPYDTGDSELELPRATIGFDFFSSDVFLTVEYHFNGSGVDDTDDYIAHFESETITQGQTYLLGQHYAGAALSYTPWELITLTTSAITNLTDPSVILTFAANYSVASDVDISLGSYVTFGEAPTIALPPVLNSEFGTYPDLYYLFVSAYF